MSETKAEMEASRHRLLDRIDEKDEQIAQLREQVSKLGLEIKSKNDKLHDLNVQFMHVKRKLAKLQATIEWVRRCGFMSQEYHPDIHGRTEAGWYFAGEQVRNALSESEAR